MGGGQGRHFAMQGAAVGHSSARTSTTCCLPCRYAVSVCRVDGESDQLGDKERGSRIPHPRPIPPTRLLFLSPPFEGPTNIHGACALLSPHFPTLSLGGDLKGTTSIHGHTYACARALQAFSPPSVVGPYSDLGAGPCRKFRRLLRAYSESLVNPKGTRETTKKPVGFVRQNVRRDGAPNDDLRAVLDKRWGVQYTYKYTLAR